MIVEQLSAPVTALVDTTWTILDAANAVIANNLGRKPPMIRMTPSPWTPAGA